MQPTGKLAVSGRARQLAVTIYRATGDFPSHERFGLTSQMRRAVVSIGSNIAEGCGREGDRALVAFLQVAFGSASELEFQIELSVELEFLSAERAAPVLAETRQLMKMLGALIGALRKALERDSGKKQPRSKKPSSPD